MNFYEYEITSPYGKRADPIDHTIKTHYGIDYALPMNTEVLSNVSGTVITSNYDVDGYGNYVVVKDGTGKLHYYAHLKKSNVSVGDIINVNDSIGLSGSSGKSTGPHLHYEVKDSNGDNINPSTYLTETQTTTETETETEIPSMDNTKWYDIKGKLQVVVFNIFKFIIIALLIVLFVVFITKALDINIL